MTVSKKIVLRFSPKIVEEPIIYSLIKDYGLIPNILKAEINPHSEGYLVVEVKGEDQQYADGIEYLKSVGVEIEALDETVTWIEDRCTQCGLCTGVCPTQAFKMNRPEMNVTFDGGKCIVCEICVKTCPAKAIRLNF